MGKNIENLKKQVRDFYKGKKVFITGHTGFKGSWLCAVLKMFGAEIHGYSLEPEEDKILYHVLHKEDGKADNLEENKILVTQITETFADIRNLETLTKAMQNFQPDIVIHMAAQPLVRESYDNPVYTYDVNVMGTVNVLEASRKCSSIKSIVNVTTDKVYENKEWCWGYREDERLNGYDPYSNSKSCSELITETYRKCFFNNQHTGDSEKGGNASISSVPVSTVRAGNVIGGGDFAKDRIIPDCIRTALGQTVEKEIVVRNPYAVRPYQHVLEPLYAYLLVGMMQYNDNQLQGSYNVGPNREDCVETGQLTSLFCEAWGEGLIWSDRSEKNAVHEANFLALDSTKIKTMLGYEQTWDVQQAVKKTVEWAKSYSNKNDMHKVTKDQINAFMEI